MATISKIMILTLVTCPAIYAMESDTSTSQEATPQALDGRATPEAVVHSFASDTSNSLADSSHSNFSNISSLHNSSDFEHTTPRNTPSPDVRTPSVSPLPQPDARINSIPLSPVPEDDETTRLLSQLPSVPTDDPHIHRRSSLASSRSESGTPVLEKLRNCLSSPHPAALPCAEGGPVQLVAILSRMSQESLRDPQSDGSERYLARAFDETCRTASDEQEPLLSGKPIMEDPNLRAQLINAITADNITGCQNLLSDYALPAVCSYAGHEEPTINRARSQEMTQLLQKYGATIKPSTYCPLFSLAMKAEHSPEFAQFCADNHMPVLPDPSRSDTPLHQLCTTAYQHVNAQDVLAKAEHLFKNLTTEQAHTLLQETNAQGKTALQILESPQKNSNPKQNALLLWLREKQTRVTNPFLTSPRT